MSSAELEDIYVNLVCNVHAAISIPLALKLSPFFTGLPSMAKRFVEMGADGLVLFNRFYQPDFDVEALEVVPHLALSTSHEMLLPLRWIALLYGRVDVDFALTSGIHTTQDVIKAMMAGASVAMLTSALLEQGIGQLTTILQELRQWMEEHDYSAITQMKGSMSQRAVAQPAAFERANYMKALNSFNISLL
jgi:dihydroorotate dehydrogenase (fumarate)